MDYSSTDDVRLWPGELSQQRESIVLQLSAQAAPPIIKGIASKNLRNHRYSGEENPLAVSDCVEKEKNELAS